MSPEFSDGAQAAMIEFADWIKELNVIIKPQPEHVRTTYKRWGTYFQSTKTIYIDPRLADIQARSTLAHELAHAHHGHPGPRDEWEREAEATAAERLIGIERFTSTVRGVDLGGLMRDALGVLPRDMKRFVEEHQEEVSAVLLDAISNSSWTSYEHSANYRRKHQPTMYDTLHGQPVKEAS